MSCHSERQMPDKESYNWVSFHQHGKVFSGTFIFFLLYCDATTQQNKFDLTVFQLNFFVWGFKSRWEMHRCTMKMCHWKEDVVREGTFVSVNERHHEMPPWASQTLFTSKQEVTRAYGLLLPSHPCRPALPKRPSGREGMFLKEKWMLMLWDGLDTSYPHILPTWAHFLCLMAKSCLVMSGHVSLTATTERCVGACLCLCMCVGEWGSKIINPHLSSCYPAS